jgi:NADH:ubiquinone oxidoreductase subunit 5 (subunit L)/multisubunit Na+/H+ antiporter MnhA subunit
MLMLVGFKVGGFIGEMICLLFMIAGHVLFIIGTSKFSKILETKDGSVVKKMPIAAVIAAISCLIAADSCVIMVVIDIGVLFVLFLKIEIM